MSEPRDLKATGLGTKFSIGIQVAVTVLLAVAAAGMLTWLSERPGLRKRIDLTASGVNTLAPQTQTVIDSLPEDAPVAIDVFFRPMEAPLTAVAGEAQARFFELLVLADSEAYGKLEIEQHDLVTDIGPESRTLLRMRELHVDEPNIVVFSSGHRRAVYRLGGDIAVFDAGNPFAQGGAFVPPSIASFHGEEILIQGLRKVTQQDAPKVYFATGHGEKEIYDDEAGGMGDLHTGLTVDGFDVAWWDSQKSGAIPADADALAIVAPSQPFTLEEQQAIRNYVDAGGRALIVPHPSFDGEGSVTGILEALGLQVQQGFVSRPFFGADGRPRVGEPRVTGIKATPDDMLPHATTAPMRRADRTLQFVLTRPIRRDADRLPRGGRVLNLVRTDDTSWLDAPDADGNIDFRPGQSEKQGPHTLVCALTYPATGNPADGAERRRESRVFCVGSGDFFINRVSPYNKDFVVGAFNWLCDREFRIAVASKDPDRRRVDLQSTKALATTNLVTSLILPGAFLALGTLIFFRRRR